MDGFPVDEQPLRESVLKAYHEGREESEQARWAVDGVRQFLSGAPGGETAAGHYWFEDSPAASIKSFLVDLDRSNPNLVVSVFQPLLAAVDEIYEEKKSTVAPNLSVYVSSLAGSCAVKSQLTETVASGVIAAAIIGLSRLGKAPFEKALAERQEV